MNDFEKRENAKFFMSVLASLNDNGTYMWPSLGAVFTKVNGKFHGSKSHMKTMKQITTKEFHKYIAL